MRKGSGLASALGLIEVPGALAASSKMPIEKIYEVTASVMGRIAVIEADRITLPREFRKQAKIRKGDVLEYRLLDQINRPHHRSLCT